MEQPGIARHTIEEGMFNVRIGAVEAYTKGRLIDQSPEVWIEQSEVALIGLLQSSNISLRPPST